MVRSISRRRLVGSLAMLPALSLLASCSDSAGEAQAQTPTGNAPKPAGAVDMSDLLKAGALPDKVLGQEDAPVTIVEYASMTCPHCAHFHEQTLPVLKEKYIEPGKVKLILREFPFDPRAEAGFMLARCADDKYYPMVDVLFAQQDAWAPVKDARTALLQISRLAGFSQESFEACLTNQQLLDDVRSVRKRGEDFGVDSTPTFFIDGKRYPGALTIDQMSAIIDPLL